MAPLSEQIWAAVRDPKATPPSWVLSVLATVAVAIAYFLSARLSLALLEKPDGVAAFWPAAGVASGVNNAVARVAGLLAIAVFGVVLARTFEARVRPSLDHLGLSESARRDVNRELPKMAGAEGVRPRISCMRARRSWPNPPPPSSGSR